MSAPKDGGPAFEHTDATSEHGMALRDYFAAKALQGLTANPGGPIQANDRSGWDMVNCDANNVATLAYAMADAMLRAREPKQ